jgi:hypothetical protein
MWAFPASEQDLTVVKGDENSTLRSYHFGKGTLAHKVRLSTIRKVFAECN